MKTPEAMIAELDGIGTVPTSVAQVFGLINDPNASMGDFERVLRPDVGLTANLLKCANSAYYRAAREITSVKDAIARMGTRRVFEVVAGGSFAKAIPATLTGYGLGAEAYWGHSIAVAVLADRLGRLAGFTYPDLAFTAGLLHDLGKVVVATSLDAAGALLEHPLPEHGLHSVEAERAYLGTDHTELGELLALKWRLPKEIGGAARWHHAPLEAPAATLRYLATVVQVADTAAHVAGFGDSADQSAELDRDALERLNLEPTQVMEAIEQGKAEIERTREMMRHARPTHLRAVA